MRLTSWRGSKHQYVETHSSLAAHCNHGAQRLVSNSNLFTSPGVHAWVMCALLSAAPFTGLVLPA